MPSALSLAGVSPAISLVCFAVAQEARPFRKFSSSRSDIEVLVTGMGARNAERTIRHALETHRPSRVFTCGFAGALDPTLRIGDVVFHSSDNHLATKLSALGTKSVSFCCSERVAITAEEKRKLRDATKVDAVEMESRVISSICSDAGVPCATVRAISDLADEDLPLDFNALMTAEQKLSPWKLAIAITTAPHRIPQLIRLGKNSALAAQQLARVLNQVT
ncbi:MAG TPA: hypothetical protein VK530_18840 [Candidatus Acidoferrum sp.]|nr:hypothetical protein [Candidatus Acidoferrum sp.]